MATKAVSGSGGLADTPVFEVRFYYDPNHPARYTTYVVIGQPALAKLIAGLNALYLADGRRPDAAGIQIAVPEVVQVRQVLSPVFWHELNPYGQFWWASPDLTAREDSPILYRWFNIDRSRDCGDWSIHFTKPGTTIVLGDDE